MYVAKHWRNQKLRYRLIRKVEQVKNSGIQPDQKQLDSRLGNPQPVASRVKVFS